jgi:hypothetical protein
MHLLAAARGGNIPGGGEMPHITDLFSKNLSIREIDCQIAFASNTVKKAIAERRLWSN